MQLAKAIKSARRVFICGNGGSAANAIHIANDLVACGIACEALSADVATLTAIGNDHGFEYIFSRQIKAKGQQGDLLILLSGSGTSKNIQQAIETAREKLVDTWLITGAYMKPFATRAGNVTRRGQNMQEAEEAQLKIGHECMRWIKNAG